MSDRRSAEDGGPRPPAAQTPPDRAPGRGGDGAAFPGEALRGLAEAAERTARELSEPAARYAAWARETLERGGRVVFCGNGGSAATAQHVAAEYVVRFRRRRRPLPAEAVGTSAPELTAAANDFGFPASFARAVEARVGPNDLLVLHSTSGSSENVIRAAEAAGRRGARTVALTGADAGSLGEAVDLCLAVTSDDPARVQELHLAVEHAVVERVDAWVADGGAPERAGDGPGETESTRTGRKGRGATDGARGD